MTNYETHEITKCTKKKTSWVSWFSCFRVFVAAWLAAGPVDASAIRIRQSATPQPKQPDVHFAATPMPVADAMLQLAMLSEFSNKETEAQNWYRQLATKHAEHPLAKKAAGALKRLDSDGKPFELAAPRLGVNGDFDIRSIAGKVVVVYYWASWNQK